MNPLWIISLFLGLSEITVGVAATQASGWIQGLLAIFSVGFPICVAGTFFFVLWRRPFVLYAPRDYPRETSVTAFVKAMNLSRANSMKNLDGLVSNAVEATLEKLLPGKLTEHEIHTEIQQAIRVAREKVESSFVLVDISIIKPLAQISVPVFSDTTAREFLDELWVLVMDPIVPPYTYGITWVLEDTITGKLLDTVDGRPVRVHMDNPDKLPNIALTDFGVKPGSTLTVRLLDQTVPRRYKPGHPEYGKAR
jgi:hypothetical protein